jgi:hypothetical protein
VAELLTTPVELSIGLKDTLVNPWAYIQLPLGQGFILSNGDPKDAARDGSYPAEFGPGAIGVSSFEKKHCVKFHPRSSKEGALSLEGPALVQAGIPDRTKDFDFLYPAALTVTWDNGKHLSADERRGIEALIRGELSPEIADLLLVGGFVYYSNDWGQGHGGGRSVTGMNALTLRQNASQASHRLYFGKPEQVSPEIALELKASAEMTDRYYNSKEQRTLRDFPAMCYTTAGPFPDRGLNHFQWLPPAGRIGNQYADKQAHPFILKMRNYLTNAQFGKDGAFVYYSSFDQTGYMLPIGNPTEWETINENADEGCFRI